MIEAFEIVVKLQRPDGIATVGSWLGQLLAASGMTDDARYVLTASAGAAAKIGHAELVERIRELLEQLQADGSDEA